MTQWLFPHKKRLLRPPEQPAALSSTAAAKLTKIDDMRNASHDRNSPGSWFNAQQGCQRHGHPVELPE